MSSGLVQHFTVDDDFKLDVSLRKTVCLKSSCMSSFSTHAQLFLLGYYADAEAQCQVFHICTADGQGGLAKYSFLCPNGTIFNQNYFICDWWFNFDCAEAADLYSLNDDIAAERDAASGALDSYGAPDDGYGAPTEIIEDRALPSYEEEQASYTGEEGVIAVREGRRLGRRGGRRGGRRQQRPRGSRRFRG